MKFNLRAATFFIAFVVVFMTAITCFNFASNKKDDLKKYEYSSEILKTINFDNKILPVKHFEISALQTKIIYNDYGDNDPNGLMYALKEDSEKIKEAVKNNPDVPSELVKPLVIRVNAGDFVFVDFENELGRPASIHIQELAVDVNMSDGAYVGLNKNTTTSGTKRYFWYAKREGIFLFNDMADIRSTEDATNVHGLFGVLIVEEKGATWTDPVTGGELKSGLYADIHLPNKEDFREFAVIFHDEPPVVDINGNTTLNMENQPESTMPINYRAEPMRNRMIHEETACACDMSKTGDCSCAAEGCQCMSCECENCVMSHDSADLSGEEISMSSWYFGDPATPVVHAYVGDPVRFRLIHAGIKETHVFHMHNHQWLSEINDPKSNIIDSVSFSPQQTISFDLLHGAGSLNKTPGDIIWHCHLYPHFGMGMWGLMRVHDRLEDGQRELPNGKLTTNLIPLPDRERPLEPDELHPGYPFYLAGEDGEKAFKPPLGIEGSEFREPTDLEEANFAANAVPGALYSVPFPEDAPLKVFEISAIQLDLVYNNEGWHDPEGRIFVLKEDEEAVLSGKKKPEPLILRANVGDRIEVRLTNKLPKTIGGNDFQLLTKTTEAGYHIHLVKFDAISSDGSANGYNYDASALPGETLIETFYADRELNTIFFHDHLFANIHQQHGLFGALLIEPEGATFHDPETGEELKSGTKAVIRQVGKPDYREFVLAVHDFTLLFDKNGEPLNPPEYPSSPDDPGVMAINYTNEPLRFRNGDPAYAYSSFVHGDPATPLFETYPGDPIRIRLFDGAHEEQHSFNINGLRWHKEPNDPNSPLVQQQTLGISEAFNLFINDAYSSGDYLYYFGGVDDVWLGLWGIIRSHEGTVSHLLPLEDRNPLSEITTELPQKTGLPPEKATFEEIIYPDGAVVRKFDIVAIQKNIIYNKYGDHDPQGLMFVPKELEADIVKGELDPQPLIIRANAGDYIELTLTNHLFLPMQQDMFPSVPVDTFYPPSNRVSIHPQLLQYDVSTSDGSTVGYNKDQTIAPGESITYRWHADKELGASILTDFADIRNHRHHGLFGALIIEPRGTIYLDNKTGEELTEAYNDSVIIADGKKKFREFVVFMQDGLALYDKNGKLITQAEPEGAEQTEHEDTGLKGFNYRSERFENRLANFDETLHVLNSNIHGDPATPLFEAYTGDNIMLRLVMPSDKPRNHSFVLHGHSWKQQPSDPLSDQVSAQGAISVGSAYNIHIQGVNKFSGDYMYRSGAFRWDVEQGMWGILRLHEGDKADLFPLQNESSLFKMLITLLIVFTIVSVIVSILLITARNRCKYKL